MFNIVPFPAAVAPSYPGYPQQLSQFQQQQQFLPQQQQFQQQQYQQQFQQPQYQQQQSYADQSEETEIMWTSDLKLNNKDTHSEERWKHCQNLNSSKVSTHLAEILPSEKKSVCNRIVKCVLNISKAYHY